MNEKFLKKLSGIENMKGIFFVRFIIGIFSIFYGFLILSLHMDNGWTKISISLAFFGFGLMFILDGQSILREYFTSNQIRELVIEESKPSLIRFVEFLFIIGSVLFFIKFYNLENPSLYPVVIFLISLLLIMIFHKKISHLELSKNKILIKMQKDQERDFENLESKKKEWDFEIKEI